MNSNIIKSIAILVGGFFFGVLCHLFLMVEQKAHGDRHHWFSGIVLTVIILGFLAFMVQIIRMKAK